MTADERLAAIEGKLDRAILRLESYQQTVDGFDRRIAELRKTSEDLTASSRRLADASLRLQAERSTTLLLVAVLAAFIGAATASVVSRNAYASHSTTQEGSP